MRRAYVSSLVILAWAAVAPLQAAPPTLELPKEVTGDPGSFIQVAAKTDGKQVSWRAVDPGLNLFPVELLKDSKVAVVTAPRPGRYRLIAITAAGDELSGFAETMVIIGNAPIPPPDPPGPIPPTPLTGFSKIVFDAAAKMNDPATAKVFAANHSAIVSAIAAGAYNSLTFDQARASIFKDLAAANRPVTQANPAWQAFGAVVTTEMNAMQKRGGLNSLASIQTALDEMRIGLEAAGGK